MCEVKKIGETRNGQLFHLQKNGLFWMNFRNICYEFSYSEMEVFRSFVQDLDINDSCCPNPGCSCKFTIIPTSQPNLLLKFEKDDLAELKLLVLCKNQPVYLGFQDINYHLSWN
ncbi:MAG: DUF6686 family protein [Christiangramia sp.]|uniref:DUF6686 family protein n=1 Tax=Christiangramia sp. TaxID=1931228 RepID=UPI003242B2CD